VTVRIDPSLGQTLNLYAYGSNACFKAVTVGGPTPTQITDTSGKGNHGTFTTAPEPIQLDSGLWAYQFVSGDSEYVTVPDISELLGSTEATWLAWVRKDAYVKEQCVASDYVLATAEKKWVFGYELYDGRWACIVGNGTEIVHEFIPDVFTIGWHFVWARFVGNNANGLQLGCDDSTVTESTTAVAALGDTGHNHTYIGRLMADYSSITLGALAIFPSALSDADILKWRHMTASLIGL